MRTLPKTEDPLVLRTDFTDEKAWKDICEEIRTPNKELEFVAYVEFYNDNIFDGYTVEELLSDGSNEYIQSFIFIVDNKTVSNSEHQILCVGLNEDKGKQFRVTPSEMWSVENNLSISNMDFEEFSNAVDKDGVFRGFNE